ncbi:MAG: trypsin-like peptidase domain-containing protein [Clostridia bacterium]|nr:trypsin-like peptidase domain-containing protein [Clostridia bacterium]
MENTDNTVYNGAGGEQRPDAWGEYGDAQRHSTYEPQAREWESGDGLRGAPPSGGGTPSGGRKRGTGTGTAIAILFIALILLVLVVSALYFGAGAIEPRPTATALLPTQTIAPEETPGAVVTPVPTSRPTPIIDGEAPVLDSYGLEALPDIVEAVSPGVVSVLNYGAPTSVGQYTRENLIGTGSGFVISSEGYILTNAHVVDGANYVRVRLYNDIEYDAELVGADVSLDVAVLRIDAQGLTVLKLGESATVRVGEFVVAIGDPTGTALAGTPTFGIVSALNRSVNIDGRTNRYIQTDAAINPGNSGGPLINMNGEVIGITSAKTVTASYDEYGNPISAEGLGFALPIDDVMEVVMPLITSGYFQRPGIGLTTVYLDDATGAEHGMPSGLLVVFVLADAPACEAGLRADDIVVECEGTALKSNEQLGAIIRSRNVGDSVSVRVWRNGVYMDFEIVIGDLNQMGDEVYNDEYGGTWLG